MSIFKPGMTDFLDRLNELAQAAFSQISADWNAPAGSVKAIANKPTLAAVATSGSKADVGLSKVDNTSDVEKVAAGPIAQALSAKADSSATAQALAQKQQSLGFTPVQQGTGVNQVANLVKLGWSLQSRLKATVDATDMGNFAMEGTANAYSSLQTFGDRIASNSAGFVPSSSNWTYASVKCMGPYGGALALVDTSFPNTGGVLYAQSGDIRIANVYQGGIGNPMVFGAYHFSPGVDRGNYLGSANFRWDTVYAFTGTINTSDARWKTAVTALAAAETRWAVALAREIGTYQFLVEIEKKGGDVARHHCGMTVQRAIELGQAEGLDPLRYAFICHDSWDEKIEQFPAQYGPSIEHPAEYREVPATDDEPARQELVRAAYVEQGALIKEAYATTTPAGDIYSFRTDELNLFIARGLAAQRDSDAARMDAMEARLAALEPS